MSYTTLLVTGDVQCEMPLSPVNTCAVEINVSPLLLLSPWLASVQGTIIDDKHIDSTSFSAYHADASNTTDVMKCNNTLYV